MAAMAMAAFGWAASGGHAPPPCMLRSGAAAGPFTPKSLAAAHSAMQYAQDAAASCEAANGFGRPGCTGSGLGEAGSGSTGVFQGPTPPAPSISRNLWLGNVSARTHAARCAGSSYGPTNYLAPATVCYPSLPTPLLLDTTHSPPAPVHPSVHHLKLATSWLDTVRRHQILPLQHPLANQHPVFPPSLPR
jgi:hypothetical protein